jgi:alpha-mannosidase
MPITHSDRKWTLDRTLDDIKRSVYEVVGDLKIEAWRTTEPTPYSRRRSGKRLTLEVGDKWGKLFDCAWFHFTGAVPRTAKGEKVVLLLDVNGEMCVFDDKGMPVRGLTNVASDFWRPFGEPGKRVHPMTPRAKGGEKIDVWADAGYNDLFGKIADDGRIRQAHIAVCREDTRQLYYDFEVLLDLMKSLPDDSARHQQLLAALSDAAQVIKTFSAAEVKSARQILSRVLSAKGGDPSLRFSAIGHAHMDLGWLWPIRETKRKGARTFATMLDLMNRYPDYKFGASQPQLLLWMKESYPALYARIKEKARQGRFEVQGAMWVEADTNATGGESLVRQILQGKRFWREEFGVEVRNLWLPDVFGYTGALPQILKKSGVDYFMTTKMSWNATNSFPRHSFIWQGIDGSTVLAHMPPEGNYNSAALPHSVNSAEKNYFDKDCSRRALLLFGIGDGGGGPGEEHVERLKRIRNLSGIAPVKQEFAADFFKEWAQEAGEFQTWSGELYLEKHQGTLTTHAKNKRCNRLMENALREMEWTATLASVLMGHEYPKARLRDLWRETLLYQFHDILPGSSIKRVYDESRARYKIMLAELNAGIADNVKRLAGLLDTSAFAAPVIAFNSLSWERQQWLKVGRRWAKVTAPPMGCRALDTAATSGETFSVVASEKKIENELLRITFAGDGSIASIWDKENNREVLAEGACANQLSVYDDRGDAWEIPANYADTAPRRMKLVSAKASVDGPSAVLEQTYMIGHSRLVQRIVLMSGSRRIDFVSSADWRETNTMLRTSFPVNVLADEASCNIQFGYIERATHRNTSWEVAKDEVPAQKWIDLSQRDYGVALLNDCKYGHKIKKNVLDLNLLRSAPYPGAVVFDDSNLKPGEPNHKFGDQCDHEFTYSLYPHAGDHVDGGVMRAAYELNIPLQIVTPANGNRTGKRWMPSEKSFISVDSPNVIVETVKIAEDGDDVVVRLYESAKASTKTKVSFGFPVSNLREVDLMEENPRKLKFSNNGVDLDFRPFEIKTLRVSPSGQHPVCS